MHICISAAHLVAQKRVHACVHALENDRTSCPARSACKPTPYHVNCVRVKMCVLCRLDPPELHRPGLYASSRPATALNPENPLAPFTNTQAQHSRRPQPHTHVRSFDRWTDRKNRPVCIQTPPLPCDYGPPFHIQLNTFLSSHLIYGLHIYI